MMALHNPRWLRKFWLVSRLHKERNIDKCSDLVELATMQYFSSFIKALESKFFFRFFLLYYKYIVTLFITFT